MLEKELQLLSQGSSAHQHENLKAVEKNRILQDELDKLKSEVALLNEDKQKREKLYEVAQEKCIEMEKEVAALQGALAERTGVEATEVAHWKSEYERAIQVQKHLNDKLKESHEEMERIQGERNKQFSQLLDDYKTIKDTLQKKDEQMRQREVHYHELLARAEQRKGISEEEFQALKDELEQATQQVL